MLTIPATVSNGLWTGLPYNSGGPSAWITDTFGSYPDWRKNFDHDGDPTTPPRDFGPHKGVDLAGERAELAIHAVDDGEVFWVGKGHPVMGNYIIIAHPQHASSLGPMPATYYLHLDSVFVKTGDEVVRGSPIAVEGWTGAVTGRHLHFAVKLGENYVDPMQFLVDPAEVPELPAVAQLDRESAMEWFVSEYYLGRSSHGGTRSMDPPEFDGYEQDGKTERWLVRMLRPQRERPA